MARKPKYRRQRNRSHADRAFVELGGHRFYLGDYGTTESRAEYRRLVAEWLAGGGRLPVPQEGITVVQVLEKFWEHVQVYYRRPDGTPTSEIANYKSCLRLLKTLYGHTNACEFGPRALKTVRSHLIEKKLARTTVNAMTKRVRSVFKWAVAEELIPPDVYHGLQAVPGLKRGRSPARETEPVRPVPQAAVEAIRPHVSREVWTLVQLQRLAGARSGEVLRLRACDIDTSGPVWVYVPAAHKTAHHGHSREIYFGPRAQELLRPWMQSRPLAEPLFSPGEAERERRAKRHADRKTPLGQGNRPGTNRKGNPQREPGDHYSVDSYRRTIHRACKEAGVTPWHPHQLRHSAATEIRKLYGLEVARVVLGHQSVVVTELYAERDRALALQVMEKLG